MSESTNTNDRRQSEDRRTRGDRRRGGEGRHVVLHVGRTDLQMGLLVNDPRGNADLLHTASIAWRDSEQRLPDPEAAAALAERLKELVAAERLAGCEASLVLNADLCVTRVASGSSTEVRTALEQMDERSQLYLSLGPGEKTIATSRVSLDARHERAAVTVARQETIELLINAVDSAGLDLQWIEAETVALARAHGALHPDDRDPVVLVQCDTQGFEIAVSHRGSLLLDYRPGAGVDDANLTDTLERHHLRLQRFCQKQVHDFSLTLREVYLAGDDRQVGRAMKDLQKNSDYAVGRLDTEAARSVWQRAPDALGSEQAAMLGRALRIVDAAPESPSPNLIGRWIAESRKHIRPMLIRSAAPIAAVLLVALAIGALNLRVSMQGANLDLQLAELAPAMTEHDALRLRMISAQDKLQRLQQLSEGTEAEDLTGLLAAISGCLPDDVWLDKLTIGDMQAVKVSGLSYSDGGPYEFVRYLNAAPSFDQVALEATGSSQTREGPVTSFDVKFLLAEPASPAAAAGNLVAKETP
ncbi:MAG: PilN domain-containing protein [Planctomycetota bacterium]